MRFEDSQFWFGALGDDLSCAVRRRTAAWLGTVVRVSALVLFASGVAAVLMHSMPVWSIYGSFAGATCFALVLDIAKRPREAGVVLSLGFWLAATAAVFLLGGVRSPGSFVFLPIVITAGLFWSWRAAAALAAASLGVEILAACLDAGNMLPSPLEQPTSGPLLRIFAGSLTMTAVLVGVALHSLRDALADVRRYALRTEEILLEIPGVIAVLDRLGVVLGVSPYAEELTGYAPGELVGRHLSRLDLFARERGARADDFRAFLKGASSSRELGLIDKSGEKLWAEARKQALVHLNGESLVRIVVTDVTRQKRAEERELELCKTVERARRLEAMGLSVGGVAHDLNNLLTVILSVGSVLETKFPEDSPTRELLDDLKQSALRATTLARQLLSSRPDEQPEPIDLHSELRALRSLLGRLAGAGVKLELQMGAEPCFVRIERARLEQVAINLVVNARDAMPSGGVLVVKTSRFKTEADDRCWVELSVIDSGVGMDSATKQRIFEPFYTTKGAGGTGLGLATVDGIVARLGGHIEVDSEPGRGTRVRVIMPEALAGEVNSTPPVFDTRLA